MATPTSDIAKKIGEIAGTNRICFDGKSKKNKCSSS